MDPVTVGIIGIAGLIVLFLLGMPIAFAMALSGFVGFACLSSWDAAFTVVARDFFEEFSSYPLSVIPMFILMGTFASASGISQRLYRTAYAWMGHWRGGLAIATIFACAGFGAICGSSTATAAAMGKIALPEMKRYGYEDSFATGTVAAGGTLGILIPPSTVLIIYGILTEQSIGKLFVAGIIPGILLSILFALTAFLVCKLRPHYAPAAEPLPWGKRLTSLSGIVEILILFSLALGGLFLGWFSPTQAGAIGAAGALLIGLIRRQISWEAFVSACRDGIRTSCMVIFIVAGATIFGHFMALTRIPFVLADSMKALPVSPMVIMIMIMLIYFLGGFFMDSMALIVLTVPIFYPMVIQLGFDPIWFGVIIVLLGEMGVITPPVGVNVFVIKGIAHDVPLERIFRGIFPFLGALIVMTALVTAFPVIATYLPSYVSY